MSGIKDVSNQNGSMNTKILSVTKKKEEGVTAFLPSAQSRAKTSNAED